MLEHELTDEQTGIYDSYSEAYAVIHTAMEASNMTQDGKALNTNSRSAAISTFEGNKQRFFNHLLTSMKCPSLIRSIEHDLERDHAPVIQIVSTSEALLNRRLEQIPSDEWNDLGIDITPREYVMDYLSHAFPVQLFEVYEDKKGITHSRSVYDSDDKPVLNQEAVAMRDALIEQLACLPAVPAALDQIIHHFSHEAIAEVTGRGTRLILEDGALKVQ
ncbi:MAG: hypothetical protein HRT36_02390 [Alphaproteobacteria bacterium]|nr:hypothetical protein [Alphaproteobacteria bacterium]